MNNIYRFRVNYNLSLSEDWRFISVEPSIPTLTAFKPLVYDNFVKNIATCVSSGFRPQTVNVNWILDNGTPETDPSPIVVENDTTNTYSVTSVYRSALRREDNGKILTCQINHKAVATPLSGSLQLNITCMLNLIVFWNWLFHFFDSLITLNFLTRTDQDNCKQDYKITDTFFISFVSIPNIVCRTKKLSILYSHVRVYTTAYV